MNVTQNAIAIGQQCFLSDVDEHAKKLEKWDPLARYFFEAVLTPNQTQDGMLVSLADLVFNIVDSVNMSDSKHALLVKTAYGMGKMKVETFHPDSKIYSSADSAYNHCVNHGIMRDKSFYHSFGDRKHNSTLQQYFSDFGRWCAKLPECYGSTENGIAVLHKRYKAFVTERKRPPSNDTVNGWFTVATQTVDTTASEAVEHAQNSAIDSTEQTDVPMVTVTLAKTVWSQLTQENPDLAKIAQVTVSDKIVDNKI